MPTKLTTSTHKGKHLTYAERQVIMVLHGLGWSNRRIAAEIDRAPQTINKEIKNGLVGQIRQVKAPKKTYTYPFSVYSPDLAQAVYTRNRQASRRPLILAECSEFIEWADTKMLVEGWSPDTAVGRARAQEKFDRIPCASTLYNYIDQRLVRTTNLDLAEKVSRNTKVKRARQNLRELGKSIEERPAEVNDRSRIGDWEIDTVQGVKGADEPVLLTLTERRTRLELIFKIDSKSASPVNQVLSQLSTRVGAEFGKVFKTITADNGSEFTSLEDAVKETTDIYYTHPYSSYERGTNERHNRMIRKYVPKGKSMKTLSHDTVTRIQNSLNNLPRKPFGYKTPTEMMLQELRALEQDVA